MNSFDELDTDLANAAARIEVPDGDLDAVVRRGRRRARSRQQVIGILAAVTVLGAGVTISRIATDDADTNLAAGPDASGASTPGDGGFTWSASEPAVGIGHHAAAATAAGQLYALSTAAGVSDYLEARPLRVWRSADGIEWDDTEAPEDLYLADLDASDDRLYAVGTGTATAAVVGGRGVHELRAGWSDDGGRTWSSHRLPVPVEKVAPVMSSMAVGAAQVASSGSVVVAVASMHGELDVPALLPNNESAPDGWAITARGVDVLGPSRGEPCAATSPSTISRGERDDVPRRIWPTWCENADGSTDVVTPQEAQGVERSYTFEELGLDRDGIDAVFGRPQLYLSIDDAPFERIAFDLPDGAVSGTTISVADDVFTLFVGTTDDEGASQGSLYRSADGRTWSQTDFGADLSWSQGILSTERSTAVLGNDKDGRPVVVVNEGSGWRTTQPAEGLAEHGERAVFLGGAAGPLGIAVVIGFDDGSRIDDRKVLLISRDGVTWHHQDLAELAGQPIAYVRWIVVAHDRIVIAAAPAGTEDTSRGIITIVGTPHE